MTDEYHIRRAGDVLHAERLPRSVLDRIRSQQPEIFAAQYQQAPVPPGGLMIKREWVRRYDEPPARTSSSQVIQSWDTASKTGGESDWSVCTTWLYHENKYYLIDVLRGRFDFPTLRERAIAYARAHKADKILIEDTGVGTALVAELASGRALGHRDQAGTRQADPHVDPIREIREWPGVFPQPSAMARGPGGRAVRFSDGTP